MTRGDVLDRLADALLEPLLARMRELWTTRLPDSLLEDEDMRAAWRAAWGWIGPLENCPRCQRAGIAGNPCPFCPPEGMVACPYSLGPGHTAQCRACKGTGFVEEL